ncbi:MAG: hypothetical protein GY787_30955, partial [Alteromonadales bacterium]|nr:hypothetical protein [Alteromonadales bacterium]
AIAAGYSEKTAAAQASRLLKDVNVINMIKEYQKTEVKLFIKTKEQKLIWLEEIAIACMTLDDEKGMVNPTAATAAIKEHNLMQGDNSPTQIETKSVKSFTDMYS